MEDAPPRPDPAAPDALAPDLDTERAFRLLVARCCADVDQQIAQFLEQDDPGGAHKARVALRRLTTTLDAFRHILKRKGYAAERARAKAIFREIGKVREADVYLDLRGDAARPKDRQKAMRLRAEVRQTLRRNRHVGFTPALMARIADGALFRASERGLAARRRPLRDTAAAALDECHADCMAYPADLADLSEVKRHDLRKALKGLRYAGEFFAPLWPSPLWPLLRGHLRDVQDGLGHLNDLAAARQRDGRTDRQAEAEALAAAARAWAALRAAPRWWDGDGAGGIS
ncbi:MAG: hypothetical protein RIR62_621 [Pseudomonadota bacterium]|jgi:CHAD domain-containing protein